MIYRWIADESGIGEELVGINFSRKMSPKITHTIFQDEIRFKLKTTTKKMCGSKTVIASNIRLLPETYIQISIHLSQCYSYNDNDPTTTGPTQLSL